MLYIKLYGKEEAAKALVEPVLILEVPFTPSLVFLRHITHTQLEESFNAVVKSSFGRNSGIVWKWAGEEVSRGSIPDNIVIAGNDGVKLLFRDRVVLFLLHEDQLDEVVKRIAIRDVRDDALMHRYEKCL